MVLFGGIAMFTLFSFGMHRPLQIKTEAMAQQAQQLQTEAAAVQAKQNSADFRALTQKLEETKRQTDKALPEDLAQGKFLTTLQQKANAHHLLLQKIAPGKASQSDDLQMLPIQLRLSGSYFSLLDFLRDLREEDRYVQIVQASAETGDEGLTSELTVCIFATIKS